MFGQSDIESTMVLTNIPMYITEKTNCPTIYSLFILATFVLIWDYISISQQKFYNKQNFGIHYSISI